MTRVLATAFVALNLFVGVAQASAPEKLSNPALEARAVALQKQLRCLVCQGESLDESNAPLAADLRAIIREDIAAGESDDAVKRYLVARYGDFILMNPPVERDTILLWFGPAGLILMGTAIAIYVTLRSRHRLMAEGAETLADEGPETGT